MSRTATGTCARRCAVSLGLGFPLAHSLARPRPSLGGLGPMRPCTRARGGGALRGAARGWDDMRAPSAAPPPLARFPPRPYLLPRISPPPSPRRCVAPLPSSRELRRALGHPPRAAPVGSAWAGHGGGGSSIGASGSGGWQVAARTCPSEVRQLRALVRVKSVSE